MLAFFSNTLASGQIRAEQIARYLDCPLDPIQYDGYTCVFVKQSYSPKWPSGSYLDIVDADHLIPTIKDKPVRLIVNNRLGAQYLRKITDKEVFCIPQHHCNFYNYIRPDREVRVVAFIGHHNVFQIHRIRFRRALLSLGLEFREMQFHRYSWPRRDKIVEFYQDTDIQVYFPIDNNFPPYNLLKDSLRIVNGGSFRIPTIGRPRPYDEVEFGGCFIPAYSAEEVVSACDKLRKDKIL